MGDALFLVMLLFLFVRRGKGVVVEGDDVLFWLLVMFGCGFVRSGTTGLFRALRRSGRILVCCSVTQSALSLLRLFSPHSLRE